MTADGRYTQFEQWHGDGQVLQRNDAEGLGGNFHRAAGVVGEAAGFLRKGGGEAGQNQHAGGDELLEHFWVSDLVIRPARRGRGPKWRR
ncbi:hypothetical protein D3C87_1863420 [compost metagenome]